MHTISNLLSRCWTAWNLRAIPDALHPSEQPTARVIPLSDEPPDHQPLHDADALDADMRPSVALRTKTLDQAEDSEQQGLGLLAQAALLRAAIRCADRGQTDLAEKLRDDADNVTTLELTGPRRPLVRIVEIDNTPV
jgi:hypothetical protein